MSNIASAPNQVLPPIEVPKATGKNICLIPPYERYGRNVWGIATELGSGSVLRPTDLMDAALHTFEGRLSDYRIAEDGKVWLEIREATGSRKTAAAMGGFLEQLIRTAMPKESDSQ